jgi:hypothetical protein
MATIERTQLTRILIGLALLDMVAVAVILALGLSPIMIVVALVALSPLTIVAVMAARRKAAEGEAQ